jgi:hypothetical protein
MMTEISTRIQLKIIQDFYLVVNTIPLLEVRESFFIISLEGSNVNLYFLVYSTALEIVE